MCNFHQKLHLTFFVNLKRKVMQKEINFIVNGIL